MKALKTYDKEKLLKILLADGEAMVRLYRFDEGSRRIDKLLREKIRYAATRAGLKVSCIKDYLFDEDDVYFYVQVRDVPVFTFCRGD